MFTVTVQTSFTASHQLTKPNGQTEALHEHNWTVRSSVAAQKLDETGLVVDFHWLKAKIKEVVTPLDGARLEELASFEDVNTSAENVAKYIYDKLEPLLGGRAKLQYIEVSETPDCRAKYSG